MTPEPSKQLEEVAVLKQWIASQPHLPDDIGDLLLRKFLHSCYWDMERAQKCVDRFCTTRTHMDEAYTSRDPMSTKIQVTFDIVHVATYITPARQEILIHQINDPGLEKFVFYDIIKAFTIVGDGWLNNYDYLPEEHIVILDIKDYTLKIIYKVSLLFLKSFFTYLLEAVPVRLKQLHVVNCPSFVDKLYNFVKPILPAELCDLINFHPGVEGLYAFMDQKSLPVEYGGEAESLAVESKKWIKKVETERDFYLNDKLWKVDLKKRSKDSKAASIVVHETFKTLSID